MKKKLFLPLALIASSAINVHQLSASVVTFFGEDINTAGDPTTAAPTNSNAARDKFFTNLTGVGTETFESFPEGTGVPFTVNFPGAGSATLSGNGVIVSGNDGGGRFPISGTQFLETDAGANFNLAFGSPIASFGFYGTDIGDFGGQIVLTLTDVNGKESTVTIPNTIGSDGSTTGSVLYFGFYDLTNTYKNISFANTSTSDVFGFDDFSIGSSQQVTPTGPPSPGNPAPTPEPGTYALMGGGLAVLAIVRHRVKKS